MREKLFQTQCNTPLGELIAIASSDGLVALAVLIFFLKRPKRDDEPPAIVEAKPVSSA
jgi:hypothetical protein